MKGVTVLYSYSLIPEGAPLEISSWFGAGALTLNFPIMIDSSNFTKSPRRFLCIPHTMELAEPVEHLELLVLTDCFLHSCRDPDPVI